MPPTKPTPKSRKPCPSDTTRKLRAEAQKYMLERNRAIVQRDGWMSFASAVCDQLGIADTASIKAEIGRLKSDLAATRKANEAIEARNRELDAQLRKALDSRAADMERLEAATRNLQAAYNAAEVLSIGPLLQWIEDRKPTPQAEKELDGLVTEIHDTISTAQKSSRDEAETLRAELNAIRSAFDAVEHQRDQLQEQVRSMRQRRDETNVRTSLVLRIDDDVRELLARMGLLGTTVGPSAESKAKIIRDVVDQLVVTGIDRATAEAKVDAMLTPDNKPEEPRRPRGQCQCGGKLGPDGVCEFSRGGPLSSLPINAGTSLEDDRGNKAEAMSPRYAPYAPATRCTLCGAPPYSPHRADCRSLR